jgi:hypothetical protein
MPMRDFAQILLILPMAFEKHKAITPLIGMLHLPAFRQNF